MAQAFYPSAQEIITTALIDIGAVDPEGGVTPTNSQLTEGLNALNYIVTAWQAHGLQVWCRTHVVANLTASVGFYELGPAGDIVIQRPLRVTQILLRDSDSVDRSLTLISRDQYQDISNKVLDGTPALAWYDPKYNLPEANSGSNAFGSINLWPRPDATVATEYDLVIQYVRPLQDHDNLADELDFPQEWYNAIRWNLAHQLCFQYEVPLGKMREIKELAKETLDLALSFSTQPESVFISPAQR